MKAIDKLLTRCMDREFYFDPKQKYNITEIDDLQSIIFDRGRKIGYFIDGYIYNEDKYVQIIVLDYSLKMSVIKEFLENCKEYNIFVIFTNIFKQEFEVKDEYDKKILKRFIDKMAYNCDMVAIETNMNCYYTMTQWGDYNTEEFSAVSILIDYIKCIPRTEIIEKVYSYNELSYQDLSVLVEAFCVKEIYYYVPKIRSINNIKYVQLTNDIFNHTINSKYKLLKENK